MTATSLTSLALPPSIAGPQPDESIKAVRQNPWRERGVTFTPTTNATIARMRSGLDWTVSKVGLRTDDLQPVPDSFAIRRDDNLKILGVVGPDYLPLQNEAVFDFFRNLAGSNRIMFETAGAFQGGAITWVLAHLPAMSIRLGDDLTKTYLLISNGHTGNKPLIVAPTTIRVICRNTLAMAEAQITRNRKSHPGLTSGFQVRHLSGMPAAMQDIKKAYAATLESHVNTTEIWEHLARTPLTSALEKTFVDAVFNKTGPDEVGRAAAIRKSRAEKINAILASPTGQVKGTKDSAFSLLQAAVEHIDFERPTRTESSTNTEEQRLLSANFGSGATLKRRAWDAILTMTGM